MGTHQGWFVLALLVGGGCDASAPSGEKSQGSLPAPGGGGQEGAGDTPRNPMLGKGTSPLQDATVVCFYHEDDPVNPAATIEHRLEITEGVSSVHARLILDTRFVDNTYGENAIGWNMAAGGKKAKAREFQQLVGSDRARLRMLDAKGVTRLEFELDYISEDSSLASGHRNLGVLGGDGAMIMGDPALLLQTSTSLDRNFNERGYTGFFESSPATDEMYTPSATAPNWEYSVVYDAWVDLVAFPDGLGDAHVDYIHASPSKTGNNTVTVVRERCPPEWGCTAPDACGEAPPDGGCQLDSDCEDEELCFGGECAPKSILI